MRRPSPLPQAGAPRPAGRARPGPTSAEDPGASPGPSPAEPDLTRTAPIIPISAPEPLLPGGGLDSGDAPERAREDPPAEDPPAERLGVRQVWSAARARRRALRAEMRRFTVRQRRRRSVWIGVGASVVLLVLATLGAAYSPLFAVREITVVGAQQLDAAAVEDALAGQLGTPLPLVDESAVKAALVGFPLVESYRLEARPPGGLVVRIVERTPIGYIQTRAGFSLVDAAGVALSTSAEPGADAPLLTVEGGVGSPVFTAVGRVLRALPESIRPQVTAVSATTPNDVTLTLGDGAASVVWGGPEDSADKGVVLASIMTARPPGTVSVYDVSSPDAVVVR